MMMRMTRGLTQVWWLPAMMGVWFNLAVLQKMLHAPSRAEGGKRAEKKTQQKLIENKLLLKKRNISGADPGNLVREHRTLNATKQANTPPENRESALFTTNCHQQTGVGADTGFWLWGSRSRNRLFEPENDSILHPGHLS